MFHCRLSTNFNKKIQKRKRKRKKTTVNTFNNEFIKIISLHKYNKINKFVEIMRLLNLNIFDSDNFGINTFNCPIPIYFLIFEFIPETLAEIVVFKLLISHEEKFSFSRRDSFETMWCNICTKIIDWKKNIDDNMRILDRKTQEWDFTDELLESYNKISSYFFEEEYDILDEPRVLDFLLYRDIVKLIERIIFFNKFSIIKEYYSLIIDDLLDEDYNSWLNTIPSANLQKFNWWYEIDDDYIYNFSINFLKKDNWMSKLIKIQKIFYGYNQKFENHSSLYLSFSKFPERLEKTHYIIEKLNLLKLRYKEDCHSTLMDRRNV